MTAVVGPLPVDLEPAPSVHELDAGYSPFPPFSAWRDLTVDDGAWSSALNLLEPARAADAATLEHAKGVARRAAAIETGAIEGLYAIDSGFTVSVATQAGAWQAAFEKQEDQVRRLIESQLAAYEELVDLATKTAPLAETWIRELHRSLCRAQKTYRVRTVIGEQEQDLPLGVYKTHANHVELPDGRTFSYAPVLDTPAEMQRLVGELSSRRFLAAHPLIQASYAHYAFVRVHPFADGNGRVARALASVYLYRAASVPFLVFASQKPEYLAALRTVDSGDSQALVTFSQKCFYDACQLVAESVRAAATPNASDAAAAIRRLYVTRGGYRHPQVDAAGAEVLRLVHDKINDLTQQLGANGELQFAHSRSNVNIGSDDTAYRSPLTVPQEAALVRIYAIAPAEAQVDVRFHYHVPIDASQDDCVRVTASTSSQRLELEMRQLIPYVSTIAQLRIATFVDAILGTAMSNTLSLAQDSLKARGFRR